MSPTILNVPFMQPKPLKPCFFLIEVVFTVDFPCFCAILLFINIFIIS